jgi:hypothetical protein
VAQVAFRVEAAFQGEVPPVLMKVRLFLCASSVFADTLICHFGMEGSRLFDLYKPFPGISLSQPSPVDDQVTQLLAFSLLGLWRKVS